MKYKTIINSHEFEIEVLPDGRLLVNGQEHLVDFLEISPSRYSVIKDFKSRELVIEEKDGEIQILLDGRLYEGSVLDERALMMANRRGGLKINSGEVKSPMPGLIVELRVAIGDTVTEGQTVVILESMKMQNELKAPRSGRVENVLTVSGKTVEKGALLLTIGDAPA